MDCIINFLGNVMSKILRPGSLLRVKRKYQILEFLESGGFSDIYIGKNTDNNRKVIIKILKNDKFDDKIQAENYWRRERAFINIQSKFAPYALQLHDAFIDRFNQNNPKFIFITSYINGYDFETWFHQFREQGRHDFHEYLIRNIFIPLADYFVFTHSHGLIHRDFSPSNIMITKYKKRITPVVIDWGAGLNFDPATIENIPQDLNDLPYSDDDQIYTPGYAPPEIDLGKIQVPQSDIYSFGMILHYAASGGEEPKELSGNALKRFKIQWEDYDYHEMLKKVVEKCIKYEPRDRYRTFERVREDLKKYLSVININNKKKKRSSFNNKNISGKS